jgi:hypothetical protein
MQSQVETQEQEAILLEEVLVQMVDMLLQKVAL